MKIHIFALRWRDEIRSVIVYGKGWGRGREYLRIIWFLRGGGGGGDISKAVFQVVSVFSYLRTSFRFCVSGMTPMSRFYSPNVVGKGQVKMQRRGSVFTPNVVLTFYTFCTHLLFSFYKGLLCRNT